MSTPNERAVAPVSGDPTPAAPPRSQLEGLGKRKKRVKAPKVAKTVKGPKAAKPSRSSRRAAAPPRQHPSAYKLIAAVALIVAIDILLFFAVGYVLGKQIL